MAGVKIPAEQKKSRTVGVRLTQAQYAWIAGEAAAQTKKNGFKVTMSAIATKLLTQAMGRA